jgi:hypothetical protein
LAELIPVEFKTDPAAPSQAQNNGAGKICNSGKCPGGALPFGFNPYVASSAASVRRDLEAHTPRLLVALLAPFSKSLSVRQDVNISHTLGVVSVVAPCREAYQGTVVGGGCRSYLRIIPSAR